MTSNLHVGRGGRQKNPGEKVPAEVIHGVARQGKLMARAS